MDRFNLWIYIHKGHAFYILITECVMKKNSGRYLHQKLRTLMGSLSSVWKWHERKSCVSLVSYSGFTPTFLEMCAIFRCVEHSRVCCYWTAQNDSILCKFYTTAPLTIQPCWENVLWQLWKIHCFTSQNKLFELMKLKVLDFKPQPVSGMI